MAKILVVDDEANIRKVLTGLLNKNGYKDVVQAENGAEALEIIQDNNIDLVISDIQMPVMDGLKLFEKVKGMDLTFIILTAYGSIETAVECVKNGVYDFMSKPFDEQELINIIQKALSERGKNYLELAFTDELPSVYFDTENSDIMRIKENLQRVVNTRAGILILGETGTGKGLLAGVMHEADKNPSQPFIKVNCSAIPSNLIESELFGYRKGAFTGATMDKPGKFELADGGTIFLDEIGELDIELQSKLLCVLQDKELTRLGDTNPIKTDVRVVAATNKDIKKAIEEKKFRKDLYFRLNVVEFTLPPLRERKGDIEKFAEYFNEKYSAEYGVEKKQFSDCAVDFMKSCPWRGNIRELENVIQKILIMEKDPEITQENMERYVNAEDVRFESKGETLFDKGRDEKARKEIELIKAALDKTGGNKTKAATELGISRRTLLYRIKEYGLS